MKSIPVKNKVTWQALIKRSNLVILGLGFSAGIPLLLIFSSLSLWLREAGVDRGDVTFFSWAALGYSFKFVWAPLVDLLPIPMLTTTLGQRRGWLILSQLAIAASILAMALIDPSASGPYQLINMALAAVALGFSAATQDIVIDALRIEMAPPEEQALLSATYIAGYRIGMITSGAGALFIASALGSTLGAYSYKAWMLTYMAMALTLLVGILSALACREPEVRKKTSTPHATGEYLRFIALFAIVAVIFAFSFFSSGPIINSLIENTLQVYNDPILVGFFFSASKLVGAVAVAALAGHLLSRISLFKTEMFSAAYLEPLKEFFSRYPSRLAVLILLVVGFYRVSDIVLGVISNVFYQDLGFSKDQIAAVVKTFGLIMTIVGGFLGGFLTLRFGVIRILLLGAILSAGTNLLFLALAQMGNDLNMLYVVISADNMSAGLASAAFVAFLSRLTNVSFTAMQYAVFSSLMTLFPKLLGGYSGSIVDTLSYSHFFVITTLLGVPVILLVWSVRNAVDN